VSPAEGRAGADVLARRAGRAPETARFIARPTASSTRPTMRGPGSPGTCSTAASMPRGPRRRIGRRTGASPRSTADDRASFVGREREIEEVVNRLRAQPLVAIVGPSGVARARSSPPASVRPCGRLGGRADPPRRRSDRRARDDPRPRRRHSVPRRALGAAAARSEALAAELVAAAARRAETLVIVVDQAESCSRCAATTPRARPSPRAGRGAARSADPRGARPA